MNLANRCASAFGRYVICFALALHALMPAGWMPASARGGALTICTGQGPIHLENVENGQPGKELPARGQEHHSDVCPFAAAIHFATFAPAVADARPSDRQERAARLPERTLVLSERKYARQAPRAPPILV